MTGSYEHASHSGAGVQNDSVTSRWQTVEVRWIEAFESTPFWKLGLICNVHSQSPSLVSLSVRRGDKGVTGVGVDAVRRTVRLDGPLAAETCSMLGGLEECPCHNADFQNPCSIHPLNWEQAPTIETLSR